MTRLFYTCPIIAAMMVKHHGVMFDDQILFGYYAGEFRISNATHRCAIMRNYKFFIHPDSLGVFESMVGDYVRVFTGKVSQGFYPDTIESVFRANDEGYPYTGNGQTVYCLESSHPDYVYADKLEIILRNRLPFVMPESEAA